MRQGACPEICSQKQQLVLSSATSLLCSDKHTPEAIKLNCSTISWDMQVLLKAAVGLNNATCGKGLSKTIK